MNAICLVVDRLHAGYLGAYGNSWIETPALDRLASQSVVFDQALVDSPQLERLYRSYWQGWHALCPAPPESRPTLAALLRQAGVTTALLTDEPQVARHPLAVDFDEVVEIDPPWQPHSAGEIHQTHFAQCFVEIIDWLEAARGPFLLWCHLGGLGTTWDAPLRFRQAYCEQGDPPPPAAADVPDRMLPADYDPDELLGIAQSYAGQVTMLDTCLGAMFEFLDGLPAARRNLADAHFGARLSAWASIGAWGRATTPCLASWFTCPGCSACPRWRRATVTVCRTRPVPRVLRHKMSVPFSAAPCEATRWSSRPISGRRCWIGGASIRCPTRPPPPA